MVGPVGCAALGRAAGRCLAAARTSVAWVGAAGLAAGLAAAAGLTAAAGLAAADFAAALGAASRGLGAWLAAGCLAGWAAPRTSSRPEVFVWLEEDPCDEVFAVVTAPPSAWAGAEPIEAPATPIIPAAAAPAASSDTLECLRTRLEVLLYREDVDMRELIRGNKS